MKTIKLTILLAALVSAPAYAYHDTGGHGDSPEAQVDIKLNDSQQKALDELYEVFPSAGMLTSARGEINGRIQLQRSMTARQQETLQALYEAFPDYQSLSGALGKLDGHIDEKKGEVLAELHQNLSLPAFGGAEGEEAVVVEFADYQCGYCKRMFSVLRDENVRVKVVEFPILGEISRKAAQYALAAEKQNLYGEFHIALMGRQGRLTEEALEETAVATGLDMEKLKADSESEEITKKLDENFRIARLLGVRGTPFLVVGGQSVPGAVSRERLREMLGSEQ